MAFYEVVFPENIAYGATGGTGWLTRIVSTEAGYEYRNQLWARQRGKWDVAQGISTPADQKKFIAFLNVMRGRTHGFRFKDWTDFTDGGIGSFQTNPQAQLQLCKVYAVAGVSDTYKRFISKPRGGTLVLPGGVTVDPTTGLVTGGTPGQVWTGQFDVPCRFDIDQMQMNIQLPWSDAIDQSDVVASWDSISIIEIRV